MSLADISSSSSSSSDSSSDESSDEFISKSQNTYVSNNFAGQQRWGRIIKRNGYTLLQNFKIDPPPTGAKVISMSDVVSQMTSPRHVYMSFSSRGGKQLGQVVIRLNDKEAPKRAYQLIDLCSGHTGDTWSGSTAMWVCSKGNHDEFLGFDYYLNSNNKYTDTQKYDKLEKTGEITYKQGLVVMYYADRADFRIITKSGPKGTWPGPAIGEVVEGLGVLEKVISDDLVEADFEKSQVAISECGLVISSSYKK